MSNRQRQFIYISLSLRGRTEATSLRQGKKNNIARRSRSNLFFICCFLFLFFASCSVQKKIDQSAKTDVINTKALQAAHVGLSIFDPSTNNYLYNYQSDKYFVPASNTKIPTCYAAMKYLGDSLVGLRYGIPEEKGYNQTVIVVKPAGDPSFLLKEFSNQPVLDFFQRNIIEKKIKPVYYLDTVEYTNGWGNGWSWNDYDAGYMAERSPFPIFGNVIDLKLNAEDKRTYIDSINYPQKRVKGIVLSTGNPFFDSVVNKNASPVYIENLRQGKIKIERDIGSNEFRILNDNSVFKPTVVPFRTFNFATSLNVLSSMLNAKFEVAVPEREKGRLFYGCEGCDYASFHINKWYPIHSQPTDSLLKPMMHRSDNFFAEQSLLMVSNEKLGIMNDAKIIDTLLKTDLKDLPQKPRWVDGSGLSRYNLFTPQDFVAILNKMKNEFGMDRIKTIFATGGEGTISSYYKADSGYIYGKTGTLSGVVAFSGFMYTKKGKLLIFSTLVNNHQASATDVRRAIEKFLQGIRNKY